MGVTIYDIARDAGVSIATVSRVMNASERVSPATREQVLAVAERMGYRPHASAQSLARRRSSVVAAVIPMLTNMFFLEILNGLQDRMAESEYDLLVFSARTLEEVDQQLERALVRGRSAGTLLFSTPMSESRAALLKRSGQAVVLVDSTYPGFDAVSTDNLQGGELATRHLLSLGCRRVALLMADPESVPARDRRNGYRSALEKAGLNEEPELVVATTDPQIHGYSEEAGYDAMVRLLESGVEPDGVFATSDVQAIGAMQALDEAGIDVPGSVRVVGFDDIVLSRHLGLTTIRQPMYEIGRLAAERLMTRIGSPGRPPSQTILSPRLVTRFSTIPDPDPIGAEDSKLVTDPPRPARSHAV